jgi:hypothetical protein
MTEQSNPLAGLTTEQADEAIARLGDVVSEREESLKAAKAHLKEMRAARKGLEDPQPRDAQGDGVVAHAQAAEIAVEGSDAG